MATDAHTDTLEGRLRSAQLKVTAPRLAVLEAVSSPGHHDAETVYSMVSTQLPKTSLQAVYGVLAALVAAGLVRKFEPAGSAALYESRVGDNHHHVACLECGRVEDVDCAIGASPCLTPSNTNGFSIQIAEVTFWGVCASCQAAAASTALAVPSK
ncbi:Fur family transcriptional regulator, ferric uptake regulator [Arthrobacter alpinus]|uniref:Fur family transcriptional regulator, ferric uptake regulator n=1 Tax=Arthrobacter alpinus TaxID=656366 RepID=A0A1H5KP97_9MICC|nr:Fur family transcriptional regulator [Arthrobacter alpinus]SEE66615.1 Fur family transcriptional regulator, ferric uptake regulator [Arthrobacter alpinus]